MSLQKIRSTLGRSNAIMLVVYVLFVIFPHFAAITHSHPGGDKPHTHPYLSVQNENLKKQVLEDLGNIGGLKTVSLPAEIQEETSPVLVSIEPGASGLQPTNFWHTHFQEDPNLLAMGAALTLPLILMALRKKEKFHLPFIPSLLKFRPIARGPPSLA